ncbi:DUF1588 domain-containing protein [Lignipirellula cremea]|uniref:Planctomycete cytochrome C n=1 Tax=Lignipirellula cremea TaxID=2528010 RepID=A0A518DQB8_9BACT|nr:DUF1588 domain-containing protein [Lignipirellula cremea]QDU94035.1 Planctomycete cytochrome C [Lignipirellula cremea]
MTHRTAILFLLLTLVFPGPLCAVETDTADLQERFTAQIAPLLQTSCMDCHGADTQEGNVALHQLGGDLTAPASIAIWGRVLEQLETGAMPPSGEPQPTAAQRQAIVDWLQETLVRAGRGFELQAKRLLPEYGNRVSHALLFSGEIQTPAYTPARLWRISPHIYRGKRYQLQVAGGIEAEPVAYSSKSSGIRDYASQEVMDESGFLALQAALDDILTNQLRVKPGFQAIAEAKGQPSPEAMERVIAEEFLRATGRPINDDERARFLAFMTANIRQGGNESGLKITMLAIYLSTEAVYRMELGRGEPDAFGRRQLSPPEVALAIAYAFGDTPPAEVSILQQALRNDRLTKRSDIEAVVRQMIAAGAPPVRHELPAAFFARIVQSDDDRGFGWHPRVVRFFDEFFQYSKAAGTFKDSPGAPIGSRALTAAPQGFIAEIVNEDRHVFEELLTSPRFNENQEALLARLDALYQKKLSKTPESQHAGITAWYNDGLKSAKRLRQETFRAGILTHNSWLIAHSTNAENHPVHRGIWIRERLLAGNLPDLPIDVDATIPEGPDRTLRERHAVTRAQSCWKCHQSFDPLGMPFESFDDRGWVRTARYFDKGKNAYLPAPHLSEEELEKLRQKSEIVVIPVDATGGISGTGEPDIDGPVHDARELVQRLARSTRVRQSIIRHAFRFWMGRNEMLSDSQTLIAADQAYVTSGGKFSEVLVALLTSDSFLLRKDDSASTSASRPH